MYGVVEGRSALGGIGAAGKTCETVNRRMSLTIEDRDWLSSTIATGMDRVEANFGAAMGRMKTEMEATTGTAMDRMEATFIAAMGRMQTQIEATTGAAMGRMQTQMEATTGAAMDRMEAIFTAALNHTRIEIERRFDEKLEAVETRLLTEFHKWASPTELRLHSHATAMRALDLEIEDVKDRLRKLERPPAAPPPPIAH